MSPIGITLIALGTVCVFGLGIERPTRTIIPLYAALVPIGGVFRLAVPLPPPFNTLSSLVGGMAILGTVAHIVLYRRARIPSLAVAAWLVFLSWSALSVFWARLPSATMQELLIALPLVSLMVVVGLLPSDDRDVSLVQIAIVAGGVVIGAYALVLLLRGSALPVHGTQQRFSLVTNPDQTDPNQLAASLLLPLLLAVDLVIWGRGPWVPPRTWRLVGAVSCFLIVVAIFLTGSRGGVIATVIGLVLVLVLAGRWYPEVRRSILRFLAGTLLTVCLVAFVSLAVVHLSPEGSWVDQRIAPLQRLTNGAEGSSGRTEIWTAGLQACRLYCGLGAGLGNFPVVFTDVFATSGAGRNVGLYRPGHDLYLELAVETGVVGLTLLGLAVAAEWMALRRAGTIAAALGATLVALLAVDAFESFIWFKYFWLLFMVVRLAEAASAPARAAPAQSLREVSHDIQHQPRLERAGV